MVMDYHLKLHVKALDTQHIVLFSLLSDLKKELVDDEKVIRSKVNVLHKSWSDHEKFEEEWMQTIQYPGLDDHLLSHRIVDTNMRLLIMSPSIESLDGAIKDISTHIDTFDRLFADWYKEHYPQKELN